MNWGILADKDEFGKRLDAKVGIQKTGAPKESAQFIRSKEIKMLTNRLFNLILVAVLLLVVALAAQQALVTKAIVPQSSSVYTESKEQALREYQLGERYGETPRLTAQFSSEQIRREYILGERYGVTPEQYAAERALREYWLGERYGQTP